MAFRCLVWVKFGQVVTVRRSNLPQANHRVEAVHVPEAPCVDFYVLDDAVQALEDYVGAPMTEVGENVVPVTAWLSGQRPSWDPDGSASSASAMLWPPFRSRSGRRCRRRCPAGLTHPAGPSGPGPTPPQAALDLQLGFGWVCLLRRHRYFVLCPPSALRPLSTASLACLTMCGTCR